MSSRPRARCGTYAAAPLFVFLLSMPARAAVPDPVPRPVDDPEAEALRKAAGDETDPTTPGAAPTPGPPRPVTGLAALNPEISAVIDAAAVLVPNAPHVTGDARSGFFLRELELSFAASIDHLARFRADVAISGEGAEVEELFVFWPGLLGPVNLTVGRLRQSIDPLNRWHTHALDQADRPLVHRVFLGDEGLAQTGLRLDTTFGGGAVTELVQLEITNSENEALFAGELFSLPSFLGHATTHLALGDAAYVELGLGALVGFWSRVGDAEALGYDDAELAGTVIREPNRTSALYWVDVAAAYDPPGGTDRFGLFLRGALFQRVIDDDDGGAADGRTGAYAYAHARFDRSWSAGLRGDWVAAGDGAPSEVAVVPYLTFWQSEHLYLRLQYQLGLPSGEGASHVVTLQLDAGVGPHYHERY